MPLPPKPALALALITLLAALAIASPFRPAEALNAGSLELSAQKTPGALGSIIQVSVKDPDLTTPDSRMPFVKAQELAGAFPPVQIPLYQTEDGDWVGYIRLVSLKFFDANGNGALDEVNPTIMADRDSSGTATPDDTLLAGPSLPTGTPLATMPPLPPTAGPLAVGGKFHDSNGNSAYEPGEPLYFDSDGSYTVSRGDRRLTDADDYAAGSTVSQDDSDLGMGLINFNLESRPGNPPRQDPTPPAGGFRTSPPFTAEPHLASVGVGAIVTEVPGVSLGEAFAVIYQDESPLVAVTQTAARVLTEAALRLSADTYPLHGAVEVEVEDWDLNLDPTAPDVWMGDSALLTISTTSNPRGLGVALAEAGVNSGVFQSRFQVGPPGTEPAAEGLVVRLGDALSAVYVDADLALLQLNSTIAARAAIASTTASLSFDKPSYALGANATLTLIEPDLDLHPERPDVWDSPDWFGVSSLGGGLIVNSTSDPEGVTVAVVETGASTGVFQATFSLTREAPLGLQLKVAPGDEIEAVYRDWTPASLSHESLGVLFEEVRDRAKIAPTEALKLPFTVRGVETLSEVGVPQTAFAPGEVVLVAVSVVNDTEEPRRILVAVQVLAPDLTPLRPETLTATLRPGRELTFAPGFRLPAVAGRGDWTFEVSVLSGLPSEGGRPVAEPFFGSFSVKVPPEG